MPNETVEGADLIFEIGQKIAKDFRIKKFENSYDYLTNLSFKQLNQTNLDRLNQKVKEINSRINELNNKTGKDLWILDLENL